MVLKNMLKSVKQVSARIINLSLATIIGFSSLVAATPLLFPASAAAASITLDATYNTGVAVQAAIDAAAPNDTIVLGADVTTSSRININKAITLDGAGHRLNATFAKTSNSNNAAIGIAHSDVTIKNLIEDGTGSTNLHGINIYVSTGVILDTVTVSHNGHSGIVVNGSTVTATNLNTNSNVWNAVNVDPGSGVTTASVFTLVSGNLSDTTQIWSDGSNVSGSATVTVNAAGYNTYKVGGTAAGYFWSNGTLTSAATITKNGVTTWYSHIQSAINSAVSGDTINVGAGVYAEQITINKNLTLTGANRSTTLLQAPATPLADAITGLKNVFNVTNGAQVTVTNLGINNAVLATCSGIDYGIFVGGGATLTINHSAVTDCQNWGAIRAGANYLSQVGHLVADQNTISGYQKGGIVVDGPGSTGIITGNTITGAGPSNGDAQNGIQISRSATGSVTGNTVNNNYWTNASGNPSDNDPTTNPANADGAAGILLYQAGSGISVAQNILTGNQYGIWSVETAGSVMINGNSVTGAADFTHAKVIGIAVWNSQYSNPPVATSATISSNIVSNVAYGLIDVENMNSAPVTITAHGNSFTNFRSLAAYNGSTATVDATNNYWGSVHPTFASIIAGSVSHDPWYTNAARTILSNTPPVISLVGGSSLKIYQGTTYTDPGATATDNQGASVTVNVTNLPNSSVVGIYTVTYNAQDSFGNNATQVTRSVEVLAKVVTQTPIAPTNTVSNTVPQIVIGANAPATSTITVPAGVKNASLNVSAISTTNVDGSKSATLGGTVNINSATSVGQVTVAMPVGLTITGPSGWDGTINLPKVVTTTVTLPAAPGFTPSASSAIEVGFGDVPLTFDQPVRLVFVGQAGKTVGWSRSGVFSLITAICTTDSASGMPAGANECKIDVNGGVDLAVWTKHFTTFVTYTQTATPVAAAAPVAKVQQTYTVVAGDTLSGIGVKVGADWHSIASLNGISAPYTIYPRQVLQLPDGSVTPSASATSAPIPSSSVTTTTSVLGESSNPQIGTAISTTVGKPAVVASTVTKKANWFNWYWFAAGTAVALAAIYYAYQANKKPKN